MPSTINFLRLIADPTRLRVLLLLEQEELSVAELQEILGMGQSRISSHLAQLKRSGAVVDRRASKNVYYGWKGFSRNGARGRVRELVQTLAREIPETARDRTALKLTLRKRQDKAREYFDELAALAEKELKRSGEFVLPGMVKLVGQKRKARMGRNPATGETNSIPAKKVVKFRVAKAAKDAIVPPKPKK